MENYFSLLTDSYDCDTIQVDTLAEAVVNFTRALRADVLELDTTYTGSADYKYTACYANRTETVYIRAEQ